MTGAGPAALEALWARLESAWEDEARHAHFLEHASALGALHFAAACYRRRLPDGKAQTGLDRAVKLALQLQDGQAPDAGIGRLGRVVKIGFVFVGLMFLSATVWVLWAVVGRR
jgi:hypothetical protein